MANAGTISVNLIARTEAFAKGMSRSKKTIRSLEKATRRTMLAVKRFGLIAVGAAVGGLTVLTKKSLESIDNIAKLSDRLGVSTEFLSAFGHEAVIAGSSQEAFSNGLRYMLKNIGEANMGLKSYQDAFNEIGVSYEDMQKASPEEAFLEIAKKLRDVESQSTKTAVAMRIFGRSGTELLNLMQGDLDGVVDRAKKLGIAFSREMAAKVEEANDAIVRMQAGFQGVGNTLAIAVAPYIEAIADKITSMTAGKSSIEDMQKRLQKVAITSTYIVDAFNAVRAVVNMVVAGMQKLLEISLILPAKLAGTLASVSDAIGADDLAKKLETVQKDIEGIGADLGKAAGENFEQSMDQFGNLGELRKNLETAFKEIANKTAEVSKQAAIETVSEIEKATKASKQYSGSVEIFRSANIDLRGLQSNQDPNTFILKEMLAIQRKAFN